MSETEMKELDRWLGENLFDLHPFETAPSDSSICAHCSHHYAFEMHRPFRPTTDPAAAMEVLRACVEKAGFFPRIERIDDSDTTWFCIFPCGTVGEVDGKNIPELICKYAKELFGKDRP